MNLCQSLSVSEDSDQCGDDVLSSTCQLTTGRTAGSLVGRCIFLYLYFTYYFDSTILNIVLFNPLHFYSAEVTFHIKHETNLSNMMYCTRLNYHKENKVLRCPPVSVSTSEALLL